MTLALLTALYRAFFCFLIFFIIMEAARPGAVALFIPFWRVFGVVLLSGAAVALLKQK